MVKRVANNVLNHDNWDEDEDSEEMGTFAKAPEEVLKTRVIKTAKRRNNFSSPSTNNESKTESPSKNIFGSFAGFTKSPATASFNFLQNSSFASKSDTTKLDLTNIPKTILTANSSSTSKTDNNDAPSNTTKSEPSSEYLAKLKGLNESVSKWIQTHVATNPLCNLSPIFQDYERYFKEIEINLKTDTTKASTTKESSIKMTGNIVATPVPSIFANNSSPNVNPFLSNTNNKIEIAKESAKPSGFTFGSGSAQNFAFGNGSSTNAGFSFSGENSKPFQFKNVASSSEASGLIAIEDDEDAPPKVEFVPVVEEGHVFSQRCKVFVKKSGNFAERGVGKLFLKPIPEKEKYQLIVRADTNLGNLLVNIVLTESVPTQRMGKNNVMLVCIPLPDDKEPTPVLLRVKTAADADELLEVLNKYKK